MVNIFGENTSGQRGPRGEVGPAGAPGKRGSTGSQGSDGPPGQPGPSGKDGLSGPKGDVGLRGLTGPKGDIGVKGDAGLRGVTGAKGDAGVGLNPYFFSQKLAQSLYEILTFSCYFKTEHSGFVTVGGKVTGIKNQVGDNNAEALKRMLQVVKIAHYGFGVEFRTTLYQIPKLGWALGSNSQIIFFFAFKVSFLAHSGRQYILHNGTEEREIYLEEKKLVINGGQNLVQIPILPHSWNVCYIAFNNTPDLPSVYQINDKSGTFTTHSTLGGPAHIFLGSKGTDYFTGVLARMDILTTFSRGPGEMCNLDEGLKNSMLREHYTFFDETAPPQKKKCH